MVGWRVVNLSRSSLWGLILGFFWGMAIMNVLTVRERTQWSERVHTLSLSATRWQHESQKLRDEISLINRRMARGMFVQTVDLVMTRPPVARVEIEAALAPYTESLLGLPLSDVKVHIVYHLFQGRIITVSNRLYRVQVQAILLSPTTTLMLQIHQATSPKPE